MDVKMLRNPLDRVSISLFIDDPTPLINLSYFWIQQRNQDVGTDHRWEDIPVVIPEAFLREFATWCGENGVKGKFSVVPCPAGLGRVDEGLSLFSRRQIESWLEACRTLITPNWDITPEFLTHTRVLDIGTMQPRTPHIWEQYDWRSFDENDGVLSYMKLCCQILANVGLPPTGFHGGGASGRGSIELYARYIGEAVREVTGCKVPFFMKRGAHEPPVPTPVWYADRDAGTAVGEIMVNAGDQLGGWTGYQAVNPDYYITRDLQGGRFPALIDGGGPCVFVSHWQGYYGLHNDDHRGFRTLKVIVDRLRQRDPKGADTAWRKPSTIAVYNAAGEMAELRLEGQTIHLDLPVQVPDFTLHITGVPVRGIRCDGKPLRQVSTKTAFCSGTYLPLADGALLAYDPAGRSSRVEVLSQS